MARKNSFQSRNLSKGDLGGVIFGCTHGTMRECLDSRLFGLPGKHISYVKNIEPGLPLFLFNYSDRRLHGIFEADTHGKENINPHAWSHGLVKTKFSAQLEQEMKSLKLLSHEQLQKMSLMENNLTESKLEIQQIKDRLHVVESCLDNFQTTSCNTHLRSERIFLVGGSDGHSQLFALDDYSPSTDTLRSIQPMKTIQLHAAAAALAGQIYIFGGKSGNTCSATVVSYNPQSNEWTSCSPLSAGKKNLAGVTLHGKLFAIGGGNEDYYFSDVEMFDPDKERWIHTNPMLEKRFAPASATLNSAIYTAGGYNGEDYLKSAERFDPRERSWKCISMMNTRRGCHSLIAFNEKLYAIGGYNGTEAVSSMEVLDPRFGSWANSHPMNLSRAYAGAVAFKDSIYMMGGLKTETDYIDTVEYYKADNGWLLTDLKAIGKRCFFSAIVL